MAQCPFYTACSSHKDQFPNFPKKFIKLIENYYCYGRKERCARFMVASALNIDDVPEKLLPNQVEQAREIVKGNHRN